MKAVHEIIGINNPQSFKVLFGHDFPRVVRRCHYGYALTMLLQSHFQIQFHQSLRDFALPEIWGYGQGMHVKDPVQLWMLFEHVIWMPQYVTQYTQVTVDRRQSEAIFQVRLGRLNIALDE